MRREPVVSTNLRSVGYDEDLQTLEVEFADGEVYEYQGVPVAVHRSLMQARSKGAYFNSYIKDRYVFRRAI